MLSIESRDMKRLPAGWLCIRHRAHLGFCLLPHPASFQKYWLIKALSSLLSWMRYLLARWHYIKLNAVVRQPLLAVISHGRSDTCTFGYQPHVCRSVGRSGCLLRLQQQIYVHKFALILGSIAEIKSVERVTEHDYIEQFMFCLTSSGASVACSLSWRRVSAYPVHSAVSKCGASAGSAADNGLVYCSGQCIVSWEGNCLSALTPVVVWHQRRGCYSSQQQCTSTQLPHNLLCWLRLLLAITAAFLKHTHCCGWSRLSFIAHWWKVSG